MPKWSRLTESSRRSAPESVFEYSSAMKMLRLQQFAIVATAAFVTGCASTGDPREGGIFWSENKAEQRQEALRQQSHLTWEQAEHEQAKNAQLRERRASLRTGIAEQRRRIGAMRAELSSLQQAANTEVASTAAELEARRTKLETAPADNIEQLKAQVSDLQSEVDRLKERNKLLKETR